MYRRVLAHDILFCDSNFLNVVKENEPTKILYQLINERKKSRFLKRPKVKLFLIDTSFRYKYEIDLTLETNNDYFVCYKGNAKDVLNHPKSKKKVVLRLRVDLKDEVAREGVIARGFFNNVPVDLYDS